MLFLTCVTVCEEAFVFSMYSRKSISDNNALLYANFCARDPRRENQRGTVGDSFTPEQYRQLVKRMAEDQHTLAGSQLL